MMLKVTQDHNNCLHLLLAVCSNNDAIWHCIQDITTATVYVTGVTLRSPWFLKRQLKLQAMCVF